MVALAEAAAAAAICRFDASHQKYRLWMSRIRRNLQIVFAMPVHFSIHVYVCARKTYTDTTCVHVNERQSEWNKWERPWQLPNSLTLTLRIRCLLLLMLVTLTWFLRLFLHRWLYVRSVFILLYYISILIRWFVSVCTYFSWRKTFFLLLLLFCFAWNFVCVRVLEWYSYPISAFHVNLAWEYVTNEFVSVCWKSI